MSLGKILQMKRWTWLWDLPTQHSLDLPALPPSPPTSRCRMATDAFVTPAVRQQLGVDTGRRSPVITGRDTPFQAMSPCPRLGHMSLVAISTLGSKPHF